MVTLLRPSGKKKAVGEIAEIFRTKKLKVKTGDEVEIKDKSGFVLNHARVTFVIKDKDEPSFFILITR